MKGHGGRLVPFAAGLLGVVLVGWVLTVRAARPVTEGIPTDWSHRHLIFSQPSTPELAGRIVNDPRYIQEWYRRNVPRELALDETSSSVPFGQALRSASRQTMHTDWSEDMGSSATSGAGNFPAKYSFRVTSASCSDYVVFGTGVAGSNAQASIVAYSNLYSGCGGNVPTVFWAYDTLGQIVTSPVISGDGTQIAFVQTSSGVANLVVLKWSAGTGTATAPDVLSVTPAASYRNCAAPCMTEIPLKLGTGASDTDTTSSPYPDYTHDVLWVGGANGWLHKIAGAFRGTPAEVSTAGFPAQVNAGTKALSSPVFDINSGNIFVSDAGGFLYRVTPTGGVTASAQVDKGVGLLAGPIVDASAEKVYVFSSNDGTTGCGGKPCSSVYSFAATFLVNTAGARISVGTSSATPHSLYEAAFDSAYWASGTATGNIYICGGTGINPTLYRVPVAGGTLNTARRIAALTAAANTPACSPVTDISNPNASPGPTERIFMSVQNNGQTTGCSAGGCVTSFVVSPWQAQNAYKVGQVVLFYVAPTLYSAVVQTAGTSGAAQPAWTTATGGTTNDGSVVWLTQGNDLGLNLLAAWTTGAKGRNVRILDSNANIEETAAGGTSGASAPTWNTNAFQTTTDGTVTWTNWGAGPSALPATGGSSGIIIDNVVSAATLAGTSEVYFSTLGSQACGTTGTGGCAVQASQSLH